VNAFDHPALLYRDDAEFLAGTVPFVESGLATGEPVMVAVPDANLQRLRATLDPADIDAVEWHDMQRAGVNPGRIIPGVLLAFAERHAGKRVRIIGEPIWAGRTALEYPACAQHEALINAAFAGRDAAILCPYDTTRLDPEVIDDAYKTHPVMETPDRRWDSVGYDDPARVAAGFNRPLPDPPETAARITVGFASLAATRDLVFDQAVRAGLTPDRADTMVIAVNELATNTVQHTGDIGRLAVWVEDGVLVCQLSDTGHLTDPLAGRIPPSPTHHGGRGLVLVNQFCDLVRIHTRPGATTIRLHARL
jgi:anti-sigma regulatory factor (Ser/Thr protein kinase)